MTNICAKLKPAFGFIFLLMILMINSCSFHKDTSEMTAEEHFQYAKELLDDEDLFEAENEFRVITLRYSGTPINDDAQFYLAETYFQKEEYLVASSEYARLIRDLPQSPFIEQASYKVALCYYNLSPRPDLDQKYTDKAIREFNLFITDYPNSKLVPEAKKYIMELKTKLAEKLLDNAFIYYKLDAFESSMMYINLILERYYDTNVVKKALFQKGLVYLDQEDYSMVKDILVKLKTIGANEQYSDLLEQYIPSYVAFFGEIPAEAKTMN